MKKMLIISILLFSGKIFFAQNVAINTSGAVGDVSALLDVDAIDKGLLVPRVSLTSTSDAVTIATPATSLLVYNSATAGVIPNNVVPGYYYNSGTSGAPIWIRLSTGNGPSWLLLGNAGTIAANNFLGTTDAVDLVFRTNNTEKVRIQSGGNVLVGTAINTAKVNIVSTAPATSNSTMYIAGPGGTGFGLSGVIDIFDNQAIPQRELTLGYANGAPWYGMIDMFGVSSAVEERMGEFDFSNRALQPADARIATIAGVIPAGGTNSGSLEFITRNAGAFVSNSFWINFDGKVAVGNRAPASKFDVEGGVSIGTTYAGTSAAPANGLIVEGNAGIGTTAPGANITLQLTRAFAPSLAITNDNAATYRGVVGLSTGPNEYGVGSVAGDFAIDVQQGHDIFFGTAVGLANPTRQMIIKNGGNVGINAMAPSEKLEVGGNIRFSGALMPNNLPGSAGQILMSSGAGVAPTWSAFTVAKSTSTMTWAVPWAPGTVNTFIVAAPSCVNTSTISVAFSGPWNAALYQAVTIMNVTAEVGQFRISVINASFGAIAAGSIPISYVAYY